MRVIVSIDARRELMEAVDYYEAQGVGLGLSFIDEFEATVARIAEHPEAWQPLSADARRCMMKRFRYGVVYRIGDDVIEIYAVAHLHRKPNYWRDRQ